MGREQNICEAFCNKTSELDVFWFRLTASVGIISVATLLSADYLTKTVASDRLFLTTASISGTFFAIFFSMVLLAVQHSAKNYLPSILTEFKKDPKLIVIIALSLLSVFLSLFVYTFKLGGLVVPSLFVFALNLVAIILYFYSLLDFLNPLVVIEKLGRKTRTQMGNVKKKLLEQVEDEVASAGLTTNLALAQEAKLNDSEYQEICIREVKVLFNHIERSNAIDDFETYKKALETLFGVVDYYLLNKTVDLQSDKFVDFVLTKLKLHAEFLMKNNEHFKVIEVVDTLRDIGTSAVKRLRVLHIGGLNYTSRLVCYYIKKIGIKAIKSENLDLAKECVYALKDIALDAIRINNTTQDVETDIAEIGTHTNDWFMYHHSLGAINSLLLELIKQLLGEDSAKKRLPNSDLYSLFDKQAEVIGAAIGLCTGHKVTSSLSPALGPFSDVSLLKISKQLILVSQTPPVLLATANYEELSKKFIKVLLEKHKEVINAAKALNLTITVKNYAEFLTNLIKELSKYELKTDGAGFKSEIDYAIGALFDCRPGRQESVFDNQVKGLINYLKANNREDLIEEIEKHID